MENTSNRISLLLEANLRFLLAHLHQNTIILNMQNNSEAKESNQKIITDLLNWLKSLDDTNTLSQNDKLLIEFLKESIINTKPSNFQTSGDKPNSVTVEKTEKTEKAELPQKMIEGLKSISDQFNRTNSKEQNESVPLEKPINNNMPGTNLSETQPEQISFFFRSSDADDRWDYINSIQNFISSYEHLMHLFMPNVALEVVIELHKYDCLNKLIINEAISYPSILLQNLVTKFLREAPGSNLFRRIRRIKLDNEIEISFEQSVNISERKSIKQFVGTYFETLTKFLEVEDSSSLEIYAEKVKQSFKQFSLGPATVEMRLTAVIKHITESAFNDAEKALVNDNASLKTKVIYLASTQLMCDFQNFLLNEPRIIKFLEDLKS